MGDAAEEPPPADAPVEEEETVPGEVRKAFRPKAPWCWVRKVSTRRGKVV